MPCGSCVDKLAKKLMLHHRIDMIRAYELAERGVERASPQVLSGKGNPSDYSLACPINICYWNPRTYVCSTLHTCVCPTPLPYSHWVSGACTQTALCDQDTQLDCDAVACNGTCYYDCDAPLVWNPISLQCEVPIVPSGGASQGNFVVAALSAMSVWWHRRRKRKFIATLK